MRGSRLEAQGSNQKFDVLGSRLLKKDFGIRYHTIHVSTINQYTIDDFRQRDGVEWLRRNGTLILVVVEVLALSVWIGGMAVIISAVIPAVFNSFGMEEGGRFLTKVFHGYQYVLGMSLAVLALTAASRGLLGWRQGRLSAWIPLPEVVLLGAMGLMTGLIVSVWGPESVALQERAFAAVGETAKAEAYDAFFRTHAIVRGLYMTSLIMAVVLLCLRIRWIGTQPGRYRGGSEESEESGESNDDR